MSNEMSAEQKVRAVWPDAVFRRYVGAAEYAIETLDGKRYYSDFCATAEDAWADAAAKIPPTAYPPTPGTRIRYQLYPDSPIPTTGVVQPYAEGELPYVTDEAEPPVQRALVRGMEWEVIGGSKEAAQPPVAGGGELPKSEGHFTDTFLRKIAAEKKPHPLVVSDLLERVKAERRIIAIDLLRTRAALATRPAASDVVQELPPEPRVVGYLDAAPQELPVLSLRFPVMPAEEVGLYVGALKSQLATVMKERDEAQRATRPVVGDGELVKAAKEAADALEAAYIVISGLDGYQSDALTRLRAALARQEALEQK